MSEKEKALFGIDNFNVPRSEIPAVTHVDYSARVRDRARQHPIPRFHLAINSFVLKIRTSHLKEEVDWKSLYELD